MAPSAPTPLLKKGGAASGRAKPAPPRLLGVKRCVPAHYGTFPVLTGTPEQLRELAGAVEIIAPEPGGSVEL